MNNMERLSFSDFARIKDQIYFFATGIERHKEQLAYIPHREMGDIALIYMIKTTLESAETRWDAINYDMLQTFGISEERLHDIAQENSMRDYPVVLLSLSQVLEDTFGIHNQIPVEKNLYILTNSEMNLGAATLFYPDILQQLQKSFPQGYYILPSSIHECLILDKNNMFMATEKDLSDMVKAVNTERVAPKEQLSDYVHQYDAKKHTLVLPERMIKPDRKDRNNPIR